MAEKTFAKGLNTKIITTQYGEIIKVGVKVDEFKEFLDTYEDKGWVNMNLMTSKDGNTKYFELDTWKPDSSKSNNTGNTGSDVSVEDIPFK